MYDNFVGEDPLFPNGLRSGLPRPFSFESWLAAQANQGRTLPGSPSVEDIANANRSMAMAFSQNQQDIFALAMQNSGLVGNGAIGDGIGGLATNLSKTDALGEQLQRGVDVFGTGLGSARVTLTKYFPEGAMKLGEQLLQAIIDGGAQNLEPNELTKAIINTTLGTASSILMMTPSPFGVTQIVAGVLTAAQAIIDAIYPNGDEIKISKTLDIKKDINVDADDTNKIKDYLRGSSKHPLVAARGDKWQGLPGMNLDFHELFNPPYKQWPTRPGKNDWPGYTQVSDGNTNTAVLFSAEPLHQTMQSMAFIPGGPRRHSVFRASYNGIKDNSSRGKASKSDRQIKTLGQLKCQPANDIKHDHCVPFRNLNVPDDGPLMGSLLTRPIVNDAGAWYPASSQACAQIWSTMVNRVGPMMYAVDAMELADNWRVYFDSFRECMERLWYEHKGVGWRATILKVCSMLLCKWDPVSCSWVMRDSYTPGYQGNTILAEWPHDPRDKDLKINWRDSVYELIIRPACINLAKRQYEYLHTSAVAYLPPNARAYRDRSSTIGKAFIDMRKTLNNSGMKQYISLDDVIDKEYRDALGISAGAKATGDTPVLFALVDGLTIPPPMLPEGGVPNSGNISHLAQSMTLEGARKYGSSNPQYQRHMSILEECRGRGPEGQALRVACEGAMLFDYMLR